MADDRLPFDRLVESVGRIAECPRGSGFERAASQCLESADALLAAGRITDAQHEAIRFLVLGATMMAA